MSSKYSISNKDKKNYPETIEYNKLFRNLYGGDTGITDLVYKDFKYKNEKLYIEHPDFKGRKGIIVFYAAWCSHCNKLSQTLIDMQNEYLNKYVFGAINIENVKEKNDELAIHADVKFIPHILYINKDNSLSTYNHPINEENLLYFFNVTY
jgi:thiol-disulfide isomerase/thioredoxin